MHPFQNQFRDRAARGVFHQRCIVLTLALLLNAACLRAEGGNPFGDWPKGQSPEEIGRRVASNWLERPFGFEKGVRQYVNYQEICAWYGALRFSKLAGPEDLNRKLQEKFDFLSPDGRTHVDRDAAHVAPRVFGVIPLEIYLQTRERKYLDEGLHFADAQWRDPSEDGMTREARYWVDDIYMIAALQAKAYLVTTDPVYADRAALAMEAYLDRLQQPNGLFFHASDSPFFWARGNGWQAAALTELLTVLPTDHPRYERIMHGYRTMMAALLDLQTEEGAWRQLLDRPESWIETSGTAMFAYAMVTGVKRGWLDAERFAPAARRAWLALVSYVDDNANLREVCIGTNKACKEVGPDLEAQLAFYLARPRRAGDPHGQAPLLWTATALLK